MITVWLSQSERGWRNCHGFGVSHSHAPATGARDFVSQLTLDRWRHRPGHQL